MGTEIDNPRLLFLNQVAGPLFRELAEDLASEFGECVLLSGDGYGEEWIPKPPLLVISAPRYDRSSLKRRARSWIAYFIKALWVAILVPRQTTLFLVSNPPFLTLIGWLLKIFRGQRYVVLVYDVYPGLLVKLGRLKEGGVAARFWSWFNQTTWGSAELVFTIGDYMASNITRMLPPGGETRVAVISNWADGDFIRPKAKAHNCFAQRIGQSNKLTVMYSGNFGETHDIGSILQAAKRFRDRPEIGFVIIGEGAQRESIEQIIDGEGLANVELLMLQPEEDLPDTLTTGDICVVTLAKGIEGFSVPSKIYYMMAAGAALLVVSQGPNEMTDMLDRHGCGVHVLPGDIDGICQAIEKYLFDPGALKRARLNSRASMERYFSRSNTGDYADVLKQTVFSGEED